MSYSNINKVFVCRVYIRSALLTYIKSSTNQLNRLNVITSDNVLLLLIQKRYIYRVNHLFETLPPPIPPQIDTLLLYIYTWIIFTDTQTDTHKQPTPFFPRLTEIFLFYYFLNTLNVVYGLLSLRRFRICLLY